MYQVQIYVEDVQEWYAPGFLAVTEFTTKAEANRAARVARKCYWTTRVVHINNKESK